jgi:hypothetical protein
MVIVAMFYYPNPYNVVYLVVMPVQLFLAAIWGGVIGAIVWLIGKRIKRELKLFERAAVGITIATVLIGGLCLWQMSIGEWRAMGMLIVMGILFHTPAALMSGSSFHPLRRIVFGSSGPRAATDFGSRFALLPAFLLRVGSVFGLMESLVFFDYLLTNKTLGREGYSLVVVTDLTCFYFAGSALLSLSGVKKFQLVTLALIVNASPLFLLTNPQQYMDGNLQALAVVADVFLLLWILTVFGRLISSENNHEEQRHRRLFPLTMWEIEIRHALGRW